MIQPSINRRGSQEPCPLKRCTFCGEYKPESNDYYNKKANGKFIARCRDCEKERQRAYYEANKQKIKDRQKRYIETHKESLKAQQKAWYERNKSHVRTQGKAYREANKGKVLSQRNSYRVANREKVREWERARYQKSMESDINFRIKKNLRLRIYSALKGFNKSAKTAELLGCSIKQLRVHIESQFKKGMPWDNYGEWHVDHIRPCASFDLTDPEQQRQCFHFTNLQPLWAKENISKGPRWEGIK